MSAKPKNDNKKNDQTEARISSLQDKLNRSLADYANLEKRIESQRELFATLAATSILSKMIDVLDDFYLAQKHLNDQGLQMAIDKFSATLKSEGLEEIDTDNQQFNPEIMDCVAVVPGKQDSIVSVQKKGYRLNGQTIRPAQVIVGKENEEN